MNKTLRNKLVALVDLVTYRFALLPKSDSDISNKFLFSLQSICASKKDTLSNRILRNLREFIGLIVGLTAKRF